MFKIINSLPSFKFEFSFFATLGILSFFDKTNYFLMSIIVFILHELGHILFIMHFNGKVDKICFYGGGIKIVESENFFSKKKTLIVLFGGVIFNFIAFILFYFSKSFTLQLFSSMNFLIGIFNLLPFSYFDGGRILQLFLQSKSPSNSFKLKKFISIFTLLILTISFIFYTLKCNVKINYAIIFSIIYIFGTEFFL